MTRKQNTYVMQRVHKRNILSLVLGVVLAGWLVASLQAAAAEYSIASEYDVAADGTAVVTHLVSVTNTEGERTPTTFDFPLVGRDVESAKASFQDNTGLKTTINSDDKLLSVTVPSSLGGTTKKWSFKVSYESALLESFGATNVLQIPRSEQALNVSDETVSVAADLDLGFATTRGPEPDATDIAVGKQVLTYSNKDGAFDASIMLLFGDSAVASIGINATLKNNGFWWKTIEFALPPDTNQQQVLVESIQPRPDAVRLDADGNIVVAYSVRPKSEIQVVAGALVRVNSLNYDLSSTQTIDDIEPQLRERYTALTDNWQPQGIEVTSDATAVQQIIKQVLDQVVTRVDEDIKSNPLNVSARGQGLKYADMVVGELRSRDIPARVVLGKIFTDGNELLTEPINHAWAEAFAPGIGWMTVDPVVSTHADYFGASEVTRVGLVLWGIADNRPPINLDAIQVGFSEDEFQVQEQPVVVRATKYIVVPGISVFSVSAQTPPGTIVDGAGIRTASDNALVPLGSLAPLQTAQTRTLRMGGSAFSQEKVEYGLIAGNDLVVSAMTDSNLSFLVVFYELAALLVIAFIVGYIRYRRLRLNRSTPSSSSVQMHAESEGDDIEDANLITTPPPDTHRDTLPDVVDPADDLEQESLVPPVGDEPEAPKDDTISTVSDHDKNDQPKPPHSHLVQ